MNINATLFLQAVVFAILVWFTMKFVWPPIAKALDERALKIAEGLAAADKAKSELANANQRVEQELAQSRNETGTGWLLGRWMPLPSWNRSQTQSRSLR